MRLQNMEADLKTAERRVETLQDALKAQEEEFGSGEEGDLTRSMTGSFDDLSSSGGSYKIGEFTGSADDISDGKDTDYLSSRLTGLGGGRSTTPRAEDFTSPTYRSRRRKYDLEDEEDESKSYSRRKHTGIDEREEDSLLDRQAKGKGTPSGDEEGAETKPKKSYSNKYSDEDDDLITSSHRENRGVDLGSDDDTEWKSSRTRRRRTKLSDEEKDSDEDKKTSGRRYNRIWISDDEDDDLASWKRGREKIKISDDEDEKDTFSSRRSREKNSPLESDDLVSSRRRRYQLSDDEEDDKTPKRSSSPLAGSDNLLGTATGRRSKSKEASPGRLNGATSTERSRLSNGTKTSDSSLVGREDDNSLPTRQRRESIKELVSEEQEQLYSVAQKRRRRRRTGDAKSTRQTAQNNGSAL